MSDTLLSVLFSEPCITMADLFGLSGMSEAASKFATRLIDACQVGIGGIFAPWQMRRMASAEADANHARLLASSKAALEVAQITSEVDQLKIVAAAKAEAEAQRIQACGKIAIEKLQLQARLELERYRVELESRSLPEAIDSDEPHVEWVLDDGTEIQRLPVEPLPLRSKSRLNFQEAKRQTNVEQVVSHAFNEALPDEKVSDEPVDPDWVARFFENVKDVSNEHVQKLWGQLLAGEVAQPGTFSLRTLDVLKNLTSAEARLFERYCGYCSHQDEVIVPHGDEFATRAGVRLAELRQLVECGLFHDGKEFMKSSSEDAKPHGLVFIGRLLTIVPSKAAAAPPRLNLEDLLGRGGDGPSGKDPGRAKTGISDHFMRTTLTGTVFKLTGVGRQLSNLRPVWVDENYVSALADAIREKGFDVENLPVPDLERGEDGRPRMKEERSSPDTAESTRPSKGERA